VERFDITDERWGRFVASATDATPFHHPEWARFIADCYGFRAFALAMRGQDGEIVAGVPVIETRLPLRGRSWQSLPFTDMCSPLCRPQIALAELAAELDAARRAAGIERLDVRAPLGLAGHDRPAAWAHTIALRREPYDLLAGAARRRLRRSLHRAASLGVRIREGGSASDLDRVFYRMHLLTRRKLGVPVQSRGFFTLLWERLACTGLGRVLLAEVDGHPVAGAVFLRWNGTTIYKFGASDPAQLRYQGNSAVLWEGIRQACAGCDDAFHFGRTDFGGEGLRAFKCSFGAQEHVLTYSRLAADAPKTTRGHSRVGWAMSGILRHSPVWVTRLSGELLYRYAA
jgi:CelD/BcsL family acetyltransferase involved in cellulose biosynthesis